MPYLKITHINHFEAINWLKFNKQGDAWYENFTKKHLLHFSKIWPQLKKFYRGKDNWLAAYIDTKIAGVYYYTIVENEIYDGYLTTDKQFSQFNLGLKLNTKLLEETKNKWFINWSLCFEKYLNYNEKLGFKIDSKTVFNKQTIYLLKR